MNGLAGIQMQRITKRSRYVKNILKTTESVHTLASIPSGLCIPRITMGSTAPTGDIR